MRVEPAFSVAISGACRARTPISPSAPGTMTISASPSYAAPSGVTSATVNFRPVPGIAHRRRPLGGGPLHLLRALDRAFDRADHVERLLGQVVVLPVDDLLEAADRVLALHVLARC